MSINQDGFSKITERLEVLDNLIQYDLSSDSSSYDLLAIESEINHLIEKLKHYHKMARLNEAGLRLISN